LQAKGSISLKSTCLAEAARAAIPAIPDPEAKSKTLLFLTSDGLSKIQRAIACPPGQANAQKGGSMFFCSKSVSVICHKLVISEAVYNFISGTRGALDSLV